MNRYEFASASRTIYIDGKAESPVDTWMGWSNGRWNGDTRVIDVNSFKHRRSLRCEGRDKDKRPDDPEDDVAAAYNDFWV
jgi:hypothetical protein